MDKQYLLAPGPTPVPPEVLQRMAEPVIHHRAPVYEKILAEVREGLKYLFQTKKEVLIFASSGTGAMEGAVSNTLSAGDKVIVVEGGNLGNAGRISVKLTVCKRRYYPWNGDSPLIRL